MYRLNCTHPSSKVYCPYCSVVQCRQRGQCPDPVEKGIDALLRAADALEMRLRSCFHPVSCSFSGQLVWKGCAYILHKCSDDLLDQPHEKCTLELFSLQTSSLERRHDRASNPITRCRALNLPQGFRFTNRNYTFVFVFPTIFSGQQRSWGICLKNETFTRCRA